MRQYRANMLTTLWFSSLDSSHETSQESLPCISYYWVYASITAEGRVWQIMLGTVYGHLGVHLSRTLWSNSSPLISWLISQGLSKIWTQPERHISSAWWEPGGLSIGVWEVRHAQERSTLLRMPGIKSLTSMVRSSACLPFLMEFSAPATYKVNVCRQGVGHSVSCLPILFIYT